MSKKKAEQSKDEITIPVLKQGIARLRIIGTTGLFQNRMAKKAKETLLVGGRRKTAADKLLIKHNPLAEYRDSVEKIPDGPTAIGLKITAAKGAMCTAALETAGVTKASAQRLLFLPGDLAALYGTPMIRLDVVRSADMNRTPDVRSRAYFPKWGAEIEVRYITPQFSISSVVALLCNAGMLIGVGDFRQEKGKGSYGAFRVLGEGQDDPEWNDLVKNHGRKAQLAGLNNPEPFNSETRELIEFFRDEEKRRAA